MVRVLFVCLGNICRSPLAEGVFRRLVTERGLADKIEIDSAGTGGWHVGEPPDRRMRATAEGRGVSLHGISARRVEAGDLREFDYVFAMDRQNYRDLMSFSGAHPTAKVSLFRSFDPEPDSQDVPDPYYGGADGFEHVFDIVHRTCEAILDHIAKEHALEPSTS